MYVRMERRVRFGWWKMHGTVTSYPGTFEEYKEELQKMIKVAVKRVLILT